MSTRIVVLAAGKGKRMKADIPKPLVEIAGKSMIDHLLDNIHESGIDNLPILVVAPDSQELFRPICHEGRCEIAIQEEQLGTGDATRCAQEIVGDAETVVVLYGDHPFISAEIINQLVEMLNENNASIAMLTTKVKNFKKDFEAFYNWGRIVRDSSGGLIKIIEKKDASEEELEINEVNPSLYAFNAIWLWDHLPELKNKNASSEYYLTDLVEMAIDEGESVITASAEPFEVIGINTPEELDRAEKILGK